MSKDENKIEKMIKDRKLEAPRLTPKLIDNAIKNEQFHVFPGSQLTVCCLELRNGFSITGESAPASPKNYNKDVAEKIARSNARDKIWALEGYLLKEMLHQQQKEKEIGRN